MSNISKSKTIAICLVAVFIIGGPFVFASIFKGNEARGTENNPDTKTEDMISTALQNVKTAVDYDNIYQAIDELQKNDKTIRAFAGASLDGGDMVTSDAAPAKEDVPLSTEESKIGAAEMDVSQKTASEFSETNIQVEGVDEADVIKTNGEYIYAINTQSLYIIKANNGKPELMSKIDLESKDGEFYIEMYLKGDKIIAIRNNVYYLQPYGVYRTESTTTVDIFDVSNPEKPTKIESLSQSGNYQHSRMIDEFLYLVTEYKPAIDEMKKDAPKTFVPIFYKGEKESIAEPKDITIMPDNEYVNYTILSGIDTSKTLDFVSKKSILGDTYELYASNNTIYLTSIKYEEKETNKGKYDVIEFKETSIINSVSVNDGEVSINASATVPGRILNQFSLDEYKDVLRVVTTINNQMFFNYNEYSPQGVVDDFMMDLAEETNSSEHSAVITLDKDLKTIGSISDIAPNEIVYSCRFMGDMAYFVTFKQVDPLFSVDLSDPSNPVIVGSLKIPGFSNYLHPYDDGLLFGLGMNADDKGNTDYLKLSMFDNSDPTNVTEKHKLVLNGVYYSEASYNHKAIVINSKKKIIAFPAEDRYLIYSYDNEKGFKQVAEIRLSETGYTTNEYIRGLFVDNMFYVITSNSVNAYDMDNKYEKSGSLELPYTQEPIAIDPMPMPMPRDGMVDIIE